MRVLHLTNMYPSEGRPALGAFVKTQVASLVAAGVACDVLFVDGVGSKVNYLRAVGELNRRLRGMVYDLIHAHYSYSGFLALTQRGIPVVVSFCGENELAYRMDDILKPWQRLFQPFNARLSRFVMGRARRIIVKSSRMMELIPARYRPRTAVIPNGVDTEQFRPLDKGEVRRRLGIQPDGRYVLFPADPTDPNKGYSLVAASLDLLRQRGCPCEVLFLRGVAHADVPLYMNAADVMAFASHHEGSPNVIKEGLACDLPIVSVEVGDVRERLEGAPGSRIVPREASAFADALSEMLRHSSSSGGRERVKALSLPAVARRLVDLYDDVLRESRSGRPCAAS